MTIKRCALAAISLGLLTAAAPPQSSWTVFGLELGKPVSLPTCKHKAYPDGRVSQYVYEDDPVETCHEPDIQLRNASWRRGSVDFPLKKMPLILGINIGFTLIVDGKLEGLQFSTLGYANTNAIISELSAKFGRPTSVDKTTTTISGIAVPITHAEWRLGGLYVSYRNIDTNIEYGSLEIETPIMQTERRALELKRSAERQEL